MPTQNQFHVRICLHFRFAQVLICGIRLYYTEFLCPCPTGILSHMWKRDIRIAMWDFEYSRVITTLSFRL